MSGLSQTTDAPARAAPERRITIIQGDQHMTADPDVVLTTILGSCVAACLRDPRAGIGGMNHFLLPGQDIQSTDGNALRYGAHAMELLINALLGAGAQRSRLEAKLFGGASMMRGLTDVGAKNAAFAERFLNVEGIPVIGGSLRGTRGRRIQFWPVTGRARQVILGQDNDMLLQSERAPPPRPPEAATGGDLDLF